MYWTCPWKLQVRKNLVTVNSLACLYIDVSSIIDRFCRASLQKKYSYKQLHTNSVDG